MSESVRAAAETDQILQIQKSVESFIKTLGNQSDPATLYDPIRYILHSSGKRIRPVLTIISGKMAGGNENQLMEIAAAIEVFHNFTLVHDDIMDHASERRGVPTVHVKWDENVAILSGDMMVGMAYRLIVQSGSVHLRDILEIFSDGVDAVCEGQAFDKEFETKSDVSIQNYLEMIEKKTGWLIAASLEIGYAAIHGRNETSSKLKQLGLLLGRGFQLQDDYFDLMGDASFGKKIGGDIVEGKKTYLVLKAAEMAKGKDLDLVNRIIRHEVSFDEIEQVRSTFKKIGVLDEIEKKISETFQQTSDLLNEFSGLPHFPLLKLQIENILNRKF